MFEHKRSLSVQPFELKGVESTLTGSLGPQETQQRCIIGYMVTQHSITIKKLFSSCIVAVCGSQD